ncbi:MAG: hypothetical protein ACRC8A_07365 [Microcoleaceae cyanobacterium]
MVKFVIRNPISKEFFAKRVDTGNGKQSVVFASWPGNAMKFKTEGEAKQLLGGLRHRNLEVIEMRCVDSDFSGLFTTDFS